MARRKKVYTHCPRCGRHVSVCGPLSSRRRCYDCGLGRMVENAVQLHEHQGDAYERWRTALRRALA